MGAAVEDEGLVVEAVAAEGLGVRGGAADHAESDRDSGRALGDVDHRGVSGGGALLMGWVERG